MAQPCLEKAHLGRKQTLTYLKGYAYGSEALMSVGEQPGGDHSPGSTAAAAVAQQGTGPLMGSMAFDEPHAASPLGESLPKWVENDRKVRA
jgi:hypothetical protein